MARKNGKTEAEVMDAERELPPSDGREDNVESIDASSRGNSTQSELQKVTAERDTLLDRLARAQAEFDNARKRATREQQEYRDYALSDALKSLLPAMDSFERALQTTSAEKNSGAELRGGVELIYKQLQDALSKLGLRPIEAKGQPFDPHQHEAIEMVETTDANDQEVIEELQRGYKLKERLLRPAMVKVAKNPHQ